MPNNFLAMLQFLQIQMLSSFSDIKDDIEEWIFDKIEEMVYEIIDAFISMITETFADDLQQTLSRITDSVTQDFWNNEVVNAFISFSSFCCWGVFAASLVFLIVDIAHEYASGKSVIWANVVKGFLYGAMFAIFSYRIPPLGCQLAADMMSAFGFQGMTYDVTVTEAKLSAIMQLILLGTLNVAAIVMFFLVSARQAMVLVHLMTASFYVPEIVRGDTTKMSDWLRQLVAIIGTFFFQYIMFIGGMECICNGMVFIGISFICGAFAAPKVLERFGWQNSGRGVLGNAQSAVMTGFYMKGFVR